MKSSEPGNLFRQVVVIGLPGLGAGAQPDAGDYKDRGANTLVNVSAYLGGLELATFEWLGLGCVSAIRGVPPASPPAASFAQALRVTEGRDASGALDEAIGATARALAEAEVPVHTVGTAARGLVDGPGVEHHPIGPAEHVFEALGATLARHRRGLVVAVPEADRGLAGAGPVGVARALTRFDAALGAFLDHIGEDVLLLVTSLGGNDATIATRGEATRERAAVLAYTPALPSGVDLGTRATLADIGATASEALGVPAPAGRSFFGELLA